MGGGDDSTVKVRTMSAATKAERTRGIIHSLMNNLDDAIAIEAMLNRTNDKAFRDAYAQTVEAYGCNIVRHTLLMQLAMTLVRMHDPGRAKRAALPHLFALLNDKGVIAESRRDMPDMADRGEQAAVEAIRSARSQWRKIESGKSLERLREHRHRYLAHTLVEMPETDDAMCDDVFKLLQGTTPIVQKLALGMLGKDVNVDKVRRIRRKQANAFWSSAVAGMEAVKKAKEVG